jgi:hypothetical protein
MFTGPYRQLASVNTNNAGLVGWWKLDDAEGTDSSPSGNNGVVHGTPNPVIGPASAGALNFNGTNQYIEVSPATFTAATDLTFACWVNKGHTPGLATILVGLFGTPAGARNSMFMLFGGTSGNQLSWIEFQTIAGFTGINATDPTVVEGVWTHIAGTFQTSTGNAALYVNGLSVQTGSLSSGFPSSLAFTEIGVEFRNDTSVYDGFMLGAMDDIRIYNRILNPDEILGLYTEPFTPPIDLEKVPFFIPPPPLPLMGQIWLA